MPRAFVSGLNDNTRTEMIDLLNARLADAIHLTLAIKQAHWNLKGKGFIGVHELLDEVADRMRDGADLMAERAAILGGAAFGTADVVAKATALPKYPTDIASVEDHCEALVTQFLDFGEGLRKAIETAEEAGDSGTEDLFTEVLRAADKDCWFIGANSGKSVEDIKKAKAA